MAKHIFSVAALALSSVAFAVLIGASEEAGLFGAIISVGAYSSMQKGGA